MWNSSQLTIFGRLKCDINLEDLAYLSVFFYVVPDNTMQSQVLLGRDFIKENKLQVTLTHKVQMAKMIESTKNTNDDQNNLLLIDTTVFLEH